MREMEAIVPHLDSQGYSWELTEVLTPAGLAGALKRFQPHVLHYVGHAGVSSAIGHIILHSEGRGTSWLSAEQLAEMLPPSVGLLCLSTCFSAW